MPPVEITLIIVYFGRFPALADYFFDSCRYNTEYTFLVFSDQPEPPDLPTNIRFIPFTRTAFEELLYRKTGLKTRLHNPYKLCDYKPLYGHLFEDFLNNSAFWGYCDLDMIFGRISRFVSAEHLSGFDVISSRETGLAGNFTLYRNSDFLRTFYQHAVCWKILLKNTFYYQGFDEGFKFIPIRKSSGIGRFKEWYYRIRLKGCRKNDMNELISRHALQIRAAYLNCLLSDEIFRNRKRKNWEIMWEKGHIYDTSDGREFMYFHFYHLKHEKGYRIPEFVDSSSMSCIRFSSDQFSTG